MDVQASLLCFLANSMVFIELPLKTGFIENETVEGKNILSAGTSDQRLRLPLSRPSGTIRGAVRETMPNPVRLGQH
jgi:hypothetical protein